MGGLVDKHVKKYGDAELDSEMLAGYGTPGGGGGSTGRHLAGVRYKPEGLDNLTRITKFTRKEIQLMYRGFKQESPSSIVDRDTFTAIFQHYFPCGNSSMYAGYVFNTFDLDKNGSISFEEFLTGLSVLSRGSLQEKLEWAFALYDINDDGHITRDEMHHIVTAIYMMVGKLGIGSSPPSPQHEAIIRNHVDCVFQKMDLNQDGVITLDEFVFTCEKDSTMINSVAYFNTAFC